MNFLKWKINILKINYRGFKYFHLLEFHRVSNGLPIEIPDFLPLQQGGERKKSR